MFIEQALSTPAGVQARSPGFLDDWLPEVERLVADFGERPSGVRCALAVFALPFGKKHVAIVQVADQGSGLAFRVMVMPRSLYADLGCDPFWVSDQFAPNWSANSLEAIGPTSGPPRRTVADFTRILDVEETRTQMLLGGVQILVDGGRLVFQRNAPDDRLVRDLWTLMPNAARLITWPASFAFGNGHRFHLLVTPRTDGEGFADYTREDKAGDYPEGSYELSLQKAVEAGDQLELDRILSRRSRTQMMKFALVLLAGFLVVAVVLNYPFGGDRDRGGKGDELRLKPSDEVPALTAEERKAVAARLERIGKQLGLKRPTSDSDADLAKGLVELDRKLDEKLGEKKPTRKLEALEKLGSARRRLQALLWKHGLSNYNQPGIHGDELLERLEKSLIGRGVIKEDSGG